MQKQSGRLLACTVLALSAYGSAGADPGETTLSEQHYNVTVDVTGDKLHCNFTPGHAGTYIPVDTAWVDLKLPQDEATVFSHEDAGITVQDEQKNGRSTKGDAKDTCDRITKIVADAQAAGGKVTAKKDVSLVIVKYLSGYTDQCHRYLTERVVVHLPLGVDLSSELSRGLSTTPARDCNGK